MKTMIRKVKAEFDRDNTLAAISCLVLSITIFFIMKVLGNTYGF